jgi:hypothetical protein
VTAVAPPVVEEAPAVIEATPAPREPEPMPTPVAKGPCDDLTGLRLQQCQACNGLGPMRKFHCEQLVRDNYCRGRWGSTAGCQREGESGPTGG